MELYSKWNNLDIKFVNGHALQVVVLCDHLGQNSGAAVATSLMATTAVFQHFYFFHESANQTFVIHVGAIYKLQGSTMVLCDIGDR